MEVLGRITQSLNEYASLVLAVATVVLVAVNARLVSTTARYVRLTALMFEETRRARERQAIPFVSAAPAGGTREDHKFVLKNEGDSVAIGVMAHLVNPTLPMGKQEGRQLHLPGSVVPLVQRGALSPGASIEVPVNLGYADRSPFMIRVLYVNINAQRFEVRQPFERSHEGFPSRPLDVEFFIDGQRIAGAGLIPPEAF